MPECTPSSSGKKRPFPGNPIPAATRSRIDGDSAVFSGGKPHGRLQESKSFHGAGAGASAETRVRGNSFQLKIDPLRYTIVGTHGALCADVFGPHIERLRGRSFANMLHPDDVASFRATCQAGTEACREAAATPRSPTPSICGKWRFRGQEDMPFSEIIVVFVRQENGTACAAAAGGSMNPNFADAGPADRRAENAFLHTFDALPVSAECIVATVLPVPSSQELVSLYAMADTVSSLESSLASYVSLLHDIRNKAARIQSLAILTEEDGPASRKENLDVIAACATDMLGYCDMRQIRSEVMTGVYRDRNRWITLRELAEGIGRGNELSIVADRDAHVFLDKNVVKLCTTDVVFNAVKYTRTGSQPSVEVSVQGNELCVVVRNEVDPLDMSLPRTPIECSRCFLPGATSGKGNSTGMGLNHLMTVAKHLRVRVHMHRVEDVVVVKLAFPLPVASELGVEAGSIQAQGARSSPTTIPRGPVEANPADLVLPPPSTEVLKGALVCSLEDDPTILRMIERVMFPKLHAHPNSLAMGAHHTDPTKFAEAAIARGAAIVLLDQHLSYRQGPHGKPVMYHGTDIAMELHARRFSGLVVIMSSSSAREEQQHFLASPGVDGAVGKHLPISKRIEVLSQLYSLHLSRSKSKAPAEC